jgi:hypothetical protein
MMCEKDEKKDKTSEYTLSVHTKRKNGNPLTKPFPFLVTTLKPTALNNLPLRPQNDL